MILTPDILVTPYGDIYLINIGSYNGLVPYDTKSLYELMLSYQ